MAVLVTPGRCLFQMQLCLEAPIDVPEEYEDKDCWCCSFAKSRSSVLLLLFDSQPMMFRASSLLELVAVRGL
jgi:hypothetical protein